MKKQIHTVELNIKSFYLLPYVLGDIHDESQVLQIAKMSIRQLGPQEEITSIPVHGTAHQSSVMISKLRIPIHMLLYLSQCIITTTMDACTLGF